MALHIILLGLILLLSLGFFVFGMFTQNKVFYLGAFLTLMFCGVFIQAEQGIITGHYYDTLGELQDISYSTTEPAVNMFSWILVLIGGALSAYSGIAFVFTGPEKTPFHY